MERRSMPRWQALLVRALQGPVASNTHGYQLIRVSDRQCNITQHTIRPP
jgi:hypothetical protein